MGIQLAGLAVPRYVCEHIKRQPKTEGSIVLQKSKEGNYRIILCADCAERQRKGEDYIYPVEESPLMKGAK
jgi:hypothetical protein